jgi:hypothetical protein
MHFVSETWVSDPTTLRFGDNSANKLQRASLLKFVSRIKIGLTNNLFLAKRIENLTGRIMFLKDLQGRIIQILTSVVVLVVVVLTGSVALYL